MVTYTGDKWQSARTAVFARDDGRCQACGREDELHAHHVKPVRSFDTEEEAHYVENLVVLCKWCHGEWEGRNERPRLADPETETSINAVVQTFVEDTVYRHALSAALPTICWRWLVSNPGLCSNCLVKIAPVRTGWHDRFEETVHAVVKSERDLPTPESHIYQRDLEERYCKSCEREPIRGNCMSRAHQLHEYLTNRGYPVSVSEATNIHVHSRHEFPNSGSESIRISNTFAELLNLPCPPQTPVSYNWAVPERDVADQDPPEKDDPDDDWLSWYAAERGWPGYG